MMKGFVAYSKADSDAADRLMVHLKSLIYEGIIETWYDRQILPGDDWDERIHAELSAADIIIFCVSADLLATEYVQRVEIPTAISRRNIDDVTVIPVILQPCAWEGSALAKIQHIPAGRTVQDYARQDEVWTEVTRAVRDNVLSRQDLGRLPLRVERWVESNLRTAQDGQAGEHTPLHGEPGLIGRLHGSVPEPFPALDDWQPFCHVALSVLTLQFVIDRLYEKGEGVFERNLCAPLGQHPVGDNTDSDDDAEEQEVVDTVTQWCLEGHDFVLTDAGRFPAHPSLVHGITGEWRGWNDFLGQKPSADSYRENLHSDMIDEKAFRRYVAMATRVLYLTKQCRQTRKWSESDMFDFLRRQAKYWVWDPRHRGENYP